MAYNNQVRERAPIQWSENCFSLVNLEKLNLLTHTQKQLLNNGYCTQLPTEREMWTKMRCQNCGAKLKKYRPASATTLAAISSRFDQENSMEYNEAAGVEAAGYLTPPVKHICFFHDGQLFKGEYKCCGGRQNTKGCCSETDHLPSTIEELRQECLMHLTPRHRPQPPIRNQNLRTSSRGGKNSSLGGRASQVQGRGRGQAFSQRFGTGGRFGNGMEDSSRTGNSNTNPKRSAVALDCEMGTTTLFASTLIRLTAIDLFTGEVIIDSLVAPTPPHHILHYNTSYSGVTFAAMREATRRGNVIYGADAARELLFQYIDAETIVIVHGGESDFKALRWLHPTDRIVDTCILEGYDLAVKENGWKKNLKEVTRRRCNGIQIQNAKLLNGRNAGHDSLEDALACREIVIAWLNKIPSI